VTAGGELVLTSSSVPALLAAEPERARLRFLQFFASNIRNAHTRYAYARAAADFLAWCEQQGVRTLAGVQPLHVAAWLRGRRRPRRCRRSSSGSPRSGSCSTGWSSVRWSR
jgi:hypothetical protein